MSNSARLLLEERPQEMISGCNRSYTLLEFASVPYLGGRLSSGVNADEWCKAPRQAACDEASAPRRNRHTVLELTPTRLLIAAIPKSCRLSSRILVQVAGSVSSILRLPQCWPVALTRLMPASLYRHPASSFRC